MTPALDKGISSFGGRRDNFGGHSYDVLMAAGAPHIIVTIDTKSPIELGDFVSVFTSLASQYQKFVRTAYPDVGGEAQIFVSQVSPGSIVADLIPQMAWALPIVQEAFIQAMVTEFVHRLGNRISAYFKKGGRDERATDSDLKDFLGSVEGIARDPAGSAKIEAATFEHGKKEIRAAFKFSTGEALEAREQMENHRRELGYASGADHERVTMSFSQANIKEPGVGKRTGERVVIEKFSKKDLPLIYASRLAEDQIKYELKEADDNAFKKAFVVDVNVEMKGGRPIAYRVIHVHQVIDLPDD